MCGFVGIVDIFECDICDAHEFCLVFWVEYIFHSDGGGGLRSTFFGVDDESFVLLLLVLMFVVDVGVDCG